MNRNKVLGLIFFLAIIVGAYLLVSRGIANQSQIEFAIGEEVTLKKGQVAVLKNGVPDLSVEITKFYNQPCTEQCFWSGQGVEYTFRSNGESLTGFAVGQAFGYQIHTLDSDYETYVKFTVDKAD